MGSRLFDEIREQRGLCYSVYAIDHAFADLPVLQLGSGLESSKCAEAYTRMREIVGELKADGPTEEEVERARAYAAGRRVLAFENTNAVARYAAGQAVVYGEDIDPDGAIARARRGHLRRGPRDRRRGRPRASSRSPASGRTQWTTSSPAHTPRRGRHDRGAERRASSTGTSSASATAGRSQRAHRRRRARRGPAGRAARSASAGRSTSSCS